MSEQKKVVVTDVLGVGKAVSSLVELAGVGLFFAFITSPIWGIAWIISSC